MTESSRLAAYRSRAAASPEPETPDLDEVDENEPEDCAQPKGKPTKGSDMTDTTNKEALDAAEAKGKTAGEAAGFAAANTRMNAVLDSEHYAGREALAKSMLANDKLGADEITAFLATAPKAAATAADPEASQNANEAAAAEEARAALAETGNSGVDANNGGKATDEKAKAKAHSKGVWGRARAKVDGAKPNA